jgi:hypothetical protein
LTWGLENVDLTTTDTATAVRKLTLGTTDGAYDTEQEAAVAAGERPHVGVIVADDDGRFRAYETDLVPTWGPLFSHMVPFELPAGRVVRWTRLAQDGDPAAWKEQLRLATALEHSSKPEKRETARRTYLHLLTDAVGLLPTDVHDSTGGTPEPGKVSFDLDHRDSRAHAGVAGAIPSDRTTPLPEPTLEVGPLAFGDLISLRSTLLHEFTHLGHATKTIAAVKEWRETELKLPFSAWLDRRRRAGKIDAVEHAVIAEQVTAHSETTESLAYLRDFTSAFHLRDLAAVGEGEVADLMLFEDLGKLSSEWPRAAHAVQDKVVEELVAYRDGTLSAEHAQRFTAYVRRRRDAAGESVFGLFWGKLV